MTSGMTFWRRLAVRESLERPRLPARASRRASRPLSGRGTITEEQDTRLVHPVDETPRRTAVDELPPDRRAMSPPCHHPPAAMTFDFPTPYASLPDSELTNVSPKTDRQKKIARKRHTRARGVGGVRGHS